MKPPRSIPVWAQAPFLRLLPPWIAGILLQWYAGTGYAYPLFAYCCFLGAYSVFHFLPQSWQFQWHSLRGILLQLLITATAMLITWGQDLRNHPRWWADTYRRDDLIIVSVSGKPEEKERTYKAMVSVMGLQRKDSIIPCQGRILLYLDKKDPRASRIRYGDEIRIRRQPQPIRNGGNPGAFDYAQYASFQGIFHQVFLQPAHWDTTRRWNGSRFINSLYASREHVLRVLRRYIPGREEAGIAEALLIGYTQDLDKDLVQAYSNTGVVHIIAISGMHLGLMYGLLYWLFTRLPLIRKYRWLQAILILTALWLFALMAGGSASVVRSAVMFSFLTTGRFVFNRSSTINALAGSAFVLLAFNPYYLWDIGFQLSYTAVTGIILFQKPLYHLLFIPYKIPDLIWQALSITLAAQVFTFPLCIHYFHQFPLYFLISNLLAVPLSTLILYASILLLLVCWQPHTAQFTGEMISWLLRMLNRFVRWMNEWPLAIWDRIPATVLTTFFLYATVILSAGWLMKRSGALLFAALSALTCFMATHALEAWRAFRQEGIIIYHIPRQQAIDFVQGNRYFYVGDSIRNAAFHLQPARTQLRLFKASSQLPGLQVSGSLYQLGRQRLVIIDSLSSSNLPGAIISTDYLLLSHNPGIEIDSLLHYYKFRWIILDASNPLWKIEEWKQACERLHLQCHPVTERGAFRSD